MLKRQGAWSTTNRVPLVKQIIEKALGHAANWEPKPLAVKPASAQDPVPSGSVDASQAQKAESDDEVLVDSATSSIAPPVTSDGKVRKYFPVAFEAAKHHFL